MRERGWRWQGSYAPSCDGGGWLLGWRATLHQHGENAALFGSQLQPAGGDHTEFAGIFAGDGGEAVVAQALLHNRQDVFAGFGEEDAVGVQAGIGQAGGEQVGLAQHPEDGPVQAGENAGGKQGRGSGVFGVRPGGGGFVQRAETDAAGGQGRVDVRDAKGQDTVFRIACVTPLNPGNTLAQQGHGGSEHKANIMPRPPGVESLRVDFRTGRRLDRPANGRMPRWSRGYPSP